MRDFDAKVTNVTTQQQIGAFNQRQELQNKLAQSGGAGTVTVPQFRESGLSAGQGANSNIVKLADSQLKADTLNANNKCIGAPAPCGGSRKKRTKRSQKKSRKSKMKKKKKH
jgi:hypothetical protein